jgi:hypothetical protein
MIHRRRHCVTNLRAIQGKRQHAITERGEEIRRASVQGGDSHQCFPIRVAQIKLIQLTVDSYFLAPVSRPKICRAKVAKSTPEPTFEVVL